MLLITLQVVLLLGVIIIPLVAKKIKAKKSVKFKIDTDTTNSEYAVNEEGLLERIHRTSYPVINTPE